MRDKEMIVAFFCLGPTASEFAIPCLQITDSAYVAHSESLLYRNGYEEFKARGAKKDFFRFLHSAGALENNVSADVKNKRIYIDIFENTVYSANTQYAGNTVGLKKLALRLAIRKASEEQWLAEHMFIMGVKGPGAKRISYFTGAFPSACGKTATAMLKDETIVGDDIAYLKKKHGAIYGVNVEAGIFGIISDVNEKNDPLIWDALHRPGEVIFSNVLLTKDNTVRWLGDGLSAPKEGVNFSGQWREGARDASGNAIPCAHKNARYTIRLESLGNCDPHLNDPQGVAIDGVIYGGRDSDTWVPVQEAFDWAHGVITMGASLESETTQATIGKEGVRTFNPMSNIDFLAIPIGRYITMHLDFAKGPTRAPKIFAVNYFLKNKEGKYLNAIDDKHVWIKWMELRVHNEAKVLTMPTGLIPCFEDLARLFKEVLGKDYTREHYETQFGLKYGKILPR
jgi:phosphoenolpyruvate carboxykinase (GTP)